MVDTTLDRLGVPAHDQAVNDGLQVGLETVNEGCQADQSISADSGNLGQQVAAEQSNEHLTEDADVLAGGSEFGAVIQNRLELQLVVFNQAAGVAGEPTGDLPNRRWRKGYRCEGEAFVGVVEIVANKGVAALTPQGGDLEVKLSGVSATSLPVLVQVGLEWVELSGAGALLKAVDQFLPSGGMGKTLDGVASGASIRAPSA